MDTTKLVNHYMAKGYKLRANGDVVNLQGRVIDHITIAAAAGIEANIKAMHNIARHTPQNRMHRSQRSEAIDNKSASADSEKDKD